MVLIGTVAFSTTPSGQGREQLSKVSKGSVTGTGIVAHQVLVSHPPCSLPVLQVQAITLWKLRWCCC